MGIEHRLYNYPDIKDTILVEHPLFDPSLRGFYQDHYQFPFSVSLTYDNTDAPFVPTRGFRISSTWRYTNVADYTGEKIRVIED